MLRFQSVVSGGAESRNADVCDGNPALDFVMTSTMHPVGESNGCGAGSGFYAGETCRVVHHIVWKQNFLATASLHVARGGVVQATNTETPENRRTLLRSQKR